MFRNLIQLYSMAICFVASIIMMTTIPILISTAADFSYTEYRNANYMDNFSTNEKYIEFNKQNDKRISTTDPDYPEHIDYNKLNHKQISTTDPEAIKEIRLAERQSYIIKQKAHSLSKLFDQIIWLMTGIAFFIIHWKLYKKQVIQ